MVQHCPNLEYFCAYNTGITKIPETIGHDLPKLRSLNVHQNGIREIPSSITRLDNKIKFHIDGNSLQDPPFHITDRGIQAISDYFTSQPVIKMDPRTLLLVSSYQRDFPLVSVHASNSGDLSLDYKAKGKIQMRLQSIELVDEKRKLLSTDLFEVEKTSYFVTGTYSFEEASVLLFSEDDMELQSELGSVRYGITGDPAPQEALSIEHQSILPVSNSREENMIAFEVDEVSTEKQFASKITAARGQQVATLVTKYSFGEQKGQIALESFVITKKGIAGVSSEISSLI